MTYDEYYKKIYGQGTAQVKSAQDALDVQANANRDLINATADQNIADINTVYGTQIADAKEAAEIAHRKNEMQFSANERYLERKAAEMGLTDSGLNRTQMTANMLSHGNQGYEIDRQKQKTVDTLAAAMASKIAAENTTRNSSLAGIDSQLAIDKAKVESDWRDTAAAEATKLYEKDVENAAKYRSVYDAQGRVINQYSDDQRKAEWNNLVNAFDEGAVTNKDSAASMIYDFMSKFDLSSSEEARLLSKAGLSMGEWDQYVYNVTKPLDADDTWKAHQSIYRDGAQAESYKLSPKYITPDTWDYTKANAQNYTIIVDNATWNGGDWWGHKQTIDYNDKVTIIAPNGDVLYEKTKISKLPFSKTVKQAITNATKGAKDGDEKVLKYDLNHE